MTVQNLNGADVIVLGLARSGVSAAQLLKRQGANVFVSELKQRVDVDDHATLLETNDIAFEVGGHTQLKGRRADFIVISPGIPDQAPVVRWFAEKQIPIYSEIEVASWFCPATIVAITGSNGKTTTTSLIGAILQAWYPATFVGGNIGVPFSDAADRLTAQDYAVLEVSSFQLDRIASFRPRIALLLNFSPDHLDRYVDYSGYVAAKARIFMNQHNEDTLIYNADDQLVVQTVHHARSLKTPFSLNHHACGLVELYGEQLYVKSNDQAKQLVDLSCVLLKGRHNWANMAAASTAALRLGVPHEIIRDVLLSFQPIDHRLEFIATIDGVHFYNDSKATNSDAAKQALSSFSEPIVLLAGGRAKERNFSHLADLVQKNVRAACLFGQDRELLLHSLRFHENLNAFLFPDLVGAFAKAQQIARQGEIVLLAPMCASWDQYANFEERGNHFKSLVRQAQQQNRLPLR